MRTHLTAFALAASILSASAIELRQPKAGDAPKVVRHSIQRKHVEDVLEHDRRRMRKRQGYVEASLTNEETLYFMDVSLGTPAQKLHMHIDTGSSDLWVNVPNSQLCESGGNPCSAGGTYSANSSSSYQYLNSAFNITYVDGTGAVGDYAEDTVKFSGVTLRNQQFGIGYSSSSQEGIIGIGYPINEVAVRYGYQPYANIPENMVQNGYINTNAYSLWLNDLDASTGEILFGGVNSGKYQGKLQTLPIISEQGVYAEFIIALTAMGESGKTGSIINNIAVGALLDSGSSLMYLPNDITNAIYNAVNANYDRSQGAAFVNCDLASSSSTIDFTFSGATIQVPWNELVIPVGYTNGQPACIVGISPSNGATAVLGDTFLRSAYVVYDIANNEISLAQTDFNSTTDNIQEISKGSKVPSASTVQGAVSSVAVASGSVHVTDQIGFSSSSSAAQPTAAVGYNMALLGAAGVVAGSMFAL